MKNVLFTLAALTVSAAITPAMADGLQPGEFNSYFTEQVNGNADTVNNFQTSLDNYGFLYIAGDNNTLSNNQMNLSAMMQNANWTGTQEIVVGSGNSASVKLLGSNDVANLHLGYGGAYVATNGVDSISLTGTGNFGAMYVLGDSNNISETAMGSNDHIGGYGEYVVSGNSNNVTVSQTGTGQEADFIIGGNGNTQSLVQTGNSNIVVAIQSGNGNTAKSNQK